MTTEPKPSLIQTYLLAVISSATSLAVTQSLITSQTEQIITGAASIVVPLVLASLHTLVHAAHVKATPPVLPMPGPVMVPVPPAPPPTPPPA